MSVEARIAAFAQQVGADIKELRERPEISCYDAAGELNLNNTPQVVLMTDDSVIDAEGFTRVGGVITFQQDARVKIEGWTVVETIDNAGGVRGAPQLQGQINDIDEPGMIGKGYIRENAAGLLSAQITIRKILNVNAGDTFRMMLHDTVGNEPNEETLPGASGIMIETRRLL